ncbi:MAG: circularly permuted type 2 ATP-grasp protein, partial [Halobacteriovoraceae bacterium]|nr:circularly permuted type 2 ATP-grasp protein [Halobacteriovoraceae bacterium]
MKKASYIILLFLFLLQSCSIPFTTGSRGISSTPFVGSCNEALRGLATGYKTYDDKVAGAFKLRLKSEDGDEIIEQDAANFLLDAKGRAHPHVREFAEEYFSRSPEEIEKLNKKITEIHADNEMTFMVKDKITGLYTKVSKVPFRGFVPMPKSSYEKLTNSTEAFMVTFREILQKVYSEEHTAKNLTIDSLPEDLQKVFLDVLRSSIYYEPKLNKKAMKDYPFSAVVGFDFAIDDIMNPKPISYEANGSTPSGLSNNMLLKHALQTGDKELFEKVSKNMVQGNPFRSLKKTIESNAEAWTEQSDGISVVIGPGSGNAAHPDVASIAEFSGMPLVTPKDLYIDANRKVRLNIGKGEDNPKVTGVYSRADESFLIQSNKNNVPLRDPGFYEGTNKKLAEKYGIELEPHIGYKYTFDKKGNPNGLVFNEDGSPALMETVYQLGKDPTRPLEGQTDELIDALLDKNIYISNIGGRTLDDKRIFQIIADILAKRHLPEGAPGVGPTKTLGLSEMDELYNTPIKKLGKYVVKEPDGSGGKGVYILANEPESVRREVVEAVRNNPAYYTVQEFAEQSVVTTSNIDETGRIRLETTAMDARYYAMLDGENQLIVDPDAFLIRVASPLNGSTNTSKGAGYGMLYVVDDTGAVVKTIAKGESVLPVAPPRETIGITRQVQLDLFARQLSYLINATQEENVGNLSKLSVESLVSLHRDTMDIFGLSFSPFIQQYRNYLDGKIELADFNAILVGLKKVIESGS